MKKALFALGLCALAAYPPLPASARSAAVRYNRYSAAPYNSRYNTAPYGRYGTAPYGRYTAAPYGRYSRTVTPYNGGGAYTGVVGVFRNGRLYQQDSQSLQMQEWQDYSAAQRRDTPRRFTRRAPVQKTADKQAAEQAAAAKAQQDAARRQDLEALKYD